jgi:hypothetical protein
VEAISTASVWAQEEGIHLVDTKVFHQAAKELPVVKILWVMRHRFGMCGVNQFMKCWKYRNTSKCPQYGHIMETSSHVNRCPAQGAIDRWDKLVHELETWMSKRHSHLSLMKLIVARLGEWRHRTPRSIMEEGLEIQKMDQAQNDIGWEALLNGQVLTLWKEI